MTQAGMKPSLPLQKKGRLKAWPIAGVLALHHLFCSLLFIRLPYYIEMPGTAKIFDRCMTVDGKMDTKSGSCRLCNRSSEKADSSWFDILGDTFYRYLSAKGYDRAVVRARIYADNSIWKPRKNLAIYQRVKDSWKKQMVFSVYVMQVADGRPLKESWTSRMRHQGE